jgi:hypothetical protein
LFCTVGMADNLAAVSAVAWASPDIQRSMVQIGLECAAADPIERKSVAGARAELASLVERMKVRSPCVCTIPFCV